MFSAKAFSLLARRGSRSCLQKQQQQQSVLLAAQQRRFAGDMPVVPNSMKATLWEGHPTAPEGWETSIYFYYTVSIVSIICIINFSPDTTIESWAEQEARARLALKDKGFTDFEFGKHYQDELLTEESDKWDKFTMKAVKAGEDDDDEDDDDEEEEDDDDEDDE